MIKNKHTVNEDIAILHITRRNGDKFDVLLDAEDLMIIDKLNLSVHVSWHSDIEDYYAEICEYLGSRDGKPRYRTLLLHRLIVGSEKGTHVDHKNHNTLDNRKCNLRVSKVDENLKHRKNKNSNNKTGYRNVCWIEKDKKYIVQLQIEGKNTRLGSFEDVHEAGKFAEQMRKKYYGEFAGKN